MTIMLDRLTEQVEKMAPSNVAVQLARSSSLSKAELQQLIYDFNQNVASYERNICLHQLFETQVEKTPDAIALVFQDEVMTYRELNIRANQVAHRLRKLGVTPETLVGIYLERAPEMVIAIYGILKAGGAYVPLDPSYPRERLAFMLADTNLPVLLTQESLLKMLPAHNAQVLCLATERENLAQESAANPASGVTEENLAYVIYTSGSTGQPKGVMIEQRGICHQLQWMQSQYPLTSNDAVLLKTPFSFDLSLYEFFSPLLAGAKLVIAKAGGQKDTAYLIELIQRQNISTLFMVPSMLQMLLAEQSFAACPSLKHIFCSGEPLPFALQQRFFAQMPPAVELHNLYGPTEAAVECTYWDCERDTKLTIVPVGRPIANYQIYILDENLNPVPPGVPGELHIGGIGLARGYLNRPELTEERFIVSSLGFRVSRLGANHNELQPETQNPKPETRLYRTGDIARWLPAGIIECLGRLDFQVKIRGHRIELGEIEAVLTQHPAVRESIVIAHQDAGGDKQLVAYIVSNQATATTHNELRNYLQQKLPEYMVPGKFVRLESFPLSSNGKIDRQQLPAPDEIRLEREEDFVAPANELEHKLTEIWEKVLSLHPLGVTDNFFALGGHSLLAVRIFARVEEAFGKKFPLDTLFKAPTIRQLAALLQQPDWQPSWSSLVPLQPEGDRTPFFCVHAIGGNVLEYYELARQMGPEQPFYGLQSVGLDGQQTPFTSIEAMAAHYINEIGQLQPEGSYYLGGRSFGGVVAYEMAQQLRAQGRHVALVALLDTDPIGWLKLFKRGTALRLQARFLTLRIRRHLSNLQGLKLFGKLNYIREKVVYKKRKVETWRWQIEQKLKSERDPDLVDTLRDVEEFNYLAATNYKPCIYPDRVTFFYATEEVGSLENQFGWQTLATGGVEVVEIPGNHQSMIKSPNVELLAEQLKLRLAAMITENHKSINS